MVETPLDVFLDPNIVDRSPFYKFKSQLVSYFEATKKYYVALIAGIEQDTDQVNIVWKLNNYFVLNLIQY